MTPLNQGRRHVADHIDVLRTAALVEAADVGTTMSMYLGQQDYTFELKDVGRLVEVVQNMSPGFFSWGFVSIFADLREKYPDPFPYMGAPSASE